MLPEQETHPAVSVGRLRCDGLPDPAEDRRILEGIPKERQEKILRFRFSDDRKRSLASQLLLQKMLREKELDLSAVQRDDRGKPFVAADPSVYISISHAGRSALAAVSDVPVGCDIEPVREFPGRVVSRFFSEKEKRRMDGCISETDRRRCFFSIWTARESYIKMTGEGLGLSLSRYEILPAADRGTGSEIRFFSGLEDILLPVSVFYVLRDGRKEDCLIRQSFSSDQYCISVCTGVCHLSLE